MDNRYFERLLSYSQLLTLIHLSTFYNNLIQKQRTINHTLKLNGAKTIKSQHTLNIQTYFMCTDILGFYDIFLSI